MALGDVITNFTGHSDYINDVVFSIDNAYVISVSQDSTAKVFECDTGNVINTFSEHSAAIKGVEISSNGNYVATGDYDGYVKVWELDTGNVVSSFLAHSGDHVNSLAFSSDGNYIATVGSDFTAKVFEYDTGNMITEFTGHSGPLYAVTFSPDGTKVASGGYSCIVRIWEFDTGVEINTFEGHSSGEIVCIDYSPDSNFIVSSGGVFGSCFVWESDTGNEIFMFDEFIFAAKFSPVGKYIASGGHDGIIRIWEYDTGNIIASFEAQPETIHGLAFSLNETRIVSGCADNAVKVWELIETEGSLYFKDENGVVLNSNLDGLVVDLEIGDVSFTGDSDIMAIKFVNETGIPVEDVNIAVSNEETGIDFTMSKTQDPFDALQSLSFAGPYEDGTEEIFYLRLESDDTASLGNGSLILNISTIIE